MVSAGVGTLRKTNTRWRSVRKSSDASFTLTINPHSLSCFGSFTPAPETGLAFLFPTHMEHTMTATSIERIESAPRHMAGYCSETEYLMAAEDREHRERAAMQAQWAGSVMAGDANALAMWAPRTTDWDAVKRTPVDERITSRLPKRAQTLAECMAESLDYGKGPAMAEAMQLLINAAKSTDATLAQQATQLLARMGSAYAEYNT